MRDVLLIKIKQERACSTCVLSTNNSCKFIKVITDVRL